MKKLLILLIPFIGCSINDTDTISNDPLTVEGQIQEGKLAEIRLTNSLKFKGNIDSLEIARSIQSKAKVTLSDGSVTEVLTLKRDNSRFPFLFYRSNTIKGDLEKKYELSITVTGKSFNSTTSIPIKPKILNIDYTTARKDGVITPEFKDIKLTINNPSKTIRYFKILMKGKNNTNFENASPFIISTENINTETFPLIVNFNDFENGKKTNLLKVGETFELQIVSITKGQFDFWKSIKGDETTFLDGSSFSNETISNISNGAFGYWSGENTVTTKFKIP